VGGGAHGSAVDVAPGASVRAGEAAGLAARDASAVGALVGLVVGVAEGATVGAMATDSAGAGEDVGSSDGLAFCENTGPAMRLRAMSAIEIAASKSTAASLNGAARAERMRIYFTGS
jgi:hypothetical protein